jgi:hypothetical protein
MRPEAAAMKASFRHTRRKIFLRKDELGSGATGALLNDAAPHPEQPGEIHTCGSC